MLCSGHRSAALRGSGLCSPSGCPSVRLRHASIGRGSDGSVRPPTRVYEGSHHSPKRAPASNVHVHCFIGFRLGVRLRGRTSVRHARSTGTSPYPSTTSEATRDSQLIISVSSDPTADLSRTSLEKIRSSNVESPEPKNVWTGLPVERGATPSAAERRTATRGRSVEPNGS